MYWESGSIAPPIMNFDTRWRWVVNFNSPAALPPRKEPPVPIG